MKLVNGYHYFRIIQLFSQYQLSRSLFHEINMIFFNAVLNFTPEYQIYVKWDPRYLFDIFK